MEAAQTTSLTPGTSSRPWHNHLPAWIREDEAFARLRPQFRGTLQAIADACDAPGPDGSLLGAFGGKRLVEAAGVGRSTFWRHLERLTRLGYVVLLKRGGAFGDRNLGNIYAIPGHRSALDDRRCARRMQRMVPSADGTLKPEIIEPGTQPQLWPGSQNDPGDPARRPAPPDPPQRPRRGDTRSGAPPSPCAKSETTPVSKWDGGSPKVGHHHPLSHPLAGKNQSGAGASRPLRGRRTAEPRLSDIRDVDLTDTGRLLALHRQAIRRGWVGSSDADRLRFVAAAVRALRLGDFPPKLFRTTVERRRWLWISQADEDEARRRIQRHLHGAPARTSPAAKPIDPPPRPTVSLSADAKLARAALALARDRGPGADAFRIVQAGGPGWTRERWEQALAEMDRM
ncbi:hypothetical protein ACERK3_09515 [Phycisphaerales bacterium AB-hyl4]|uniref:Helix-turn-helix protein n=1 Tax=Natronomicrosphaera hydrolytica TaxID=3242702 RepID=A0ABV4U6F7_9BACT